MKGPSHDRLHRGVLLRSDAGPGRGAVSGIVTGDSIDAGHAWLIAELTARVPEPSAGFAEVIDTVDDRAVTYFTGSRSGVLAELTTDAPASHRVAAAATGKDRS